MNLSIRVVTPEGAPDPTPKIVAAMNRRFNAIKRANPRGYLDEFESQAESLAIEIASEMGATVRLDGDQFVFRFYS